MKASVVGFMATDRVLRGRAERSFFVSFFLTFSFFNSFCIDHMMCYSFVFKVCALEGKCNVNW